MTEPIEYLYIIKMNECNRVKIGVSESPEARLKELQTGNPELLYLLRTIPFAHAYPVEEMLHERYAAVQQAGEWFELSPEALAQLLLEQFPDALPHRRYVATRVTYGAHTSRAPARLRRQPSPAPVSPEYALLQMLCHNSHLFEQVQRQVSPDDFHDADLRAVYMVLANRALAGGPTVFPRMREESLHPRQTQLLTQMAMESTLRNPTEIAAALHDCITRIKQRLPAAQRARIIAQLRAAGDGSVEQQRLLAEYNRLSKEQSRPTG
jgi:hypothetical protein